MSISLPDADHRWRCAHCGNLTRFDVVRRSRTAEFWHLDLGGEPAIEESQAMEDVIESVTCRWCGKPDAIEIVARPAPGDPLPEENTGAQP